MKKKNIARCALALSSLCLMNNVYAADVSNQSEIESAMSSFETEINLTNNIEVPEDNTIEIKYDNFTLNGNGYGFVGKDLKFEQYSTSRTATFNNIGKIDNDGNIISSLDYVYNKYESTLNLNNSIINEIVNYGGTTNITNSAITKLTNNAGSYGIGIINLDNVNFLDTNKGTVISNYGGIRGEINGNFSGHTSSVILNQEYGGGGIDLIKGTFSNNTTTSYGSAIRNTNNGTIKSVTADFINNNNYAVYNVGTINFYNSSFYNNPNGAINSNGSFSITADNGTSEFTSNGTKGILVQSSGQTVTLNSVNDGTIKMDDNIVGAANVLYNIDLKGDESSSIYLNGQVGWANTYLNDTNLYFSPDTFSYNTNYFNPESGTVHLENNQTEDYIIYTGHFSEDADWIIDVDFPNLAADTVKSAGEGTIKLSDLNFVSEPIDGTYKVQILQGRGSNNNLQLDLSDDLIDKFNTTTVEKLYTSDEMRSDVWWDEQFHTYEQDKNITSTITLDTTSTTNDSIKYTQESTLGAIVDTGSYGDTLALINQYDNVVEDRNFNFDTENDVYEVTQNLGTTSAGTLNINGVANGDQRSTIDGNSLALFVLNNETNLNINNTKITGAQSVVTGYNKDAVLTLNNVEIKDNTNGIETAGSIYVKGNSIFENNGDGIKVTSSSSVITLDATGSEITLKEKLTGVSGAKLNLKGGPINFEKEVSVLDVTMSEALGNLRKDNVFNGLNLTVDKQSTINMANNSTNIMNLNSLTLNNNLNMHVDVDLANRSMDRIVAKDYNVGNYFVNVTKMNMLSDSDSIVTKILFADDSLKNNVSTTVSEVAYSPIWKYGVTYDKTDGQFTFTRGGGSSPVPPAPTIDTLNPSLMVSPVAAQLGGYMGMLDTYANAFTHMDMNMLKPASVRFAEANANKYAVADASPRAYYSNEMNSKGTWFKPYTSYDSVGLKNGPKVSSFSYGSFIGGDSELHKFKNGFSGVISPYVAYQGSHQSFRGNSIYQNGGTLGLTGTLYKGNFFTGLTAGVGASVADASTMYGHEDFPMLMSGIASKTGYNFEFKDGRYIIQPSLLLSYTFVNTFNYTNNAGVSIDSDPLHAIQILPSVRFVMNTKNGWQPYLTAGMNWNILDETKVSANMTSLPQMSMKPYVQYGVGVQRTMKDRLTAYLQVVLRHGGRNGVAATGGLRYMFGKEPIKNNKDL